MIRKGLQQALDLLETETSFEGKNILEIGGDEQFTLPKVFLERGADKITVTNIDSRVNVQTPDSKIVTQKANALYLDEYFTENTFDIVIGTAILEHIPETEKLLESIHYVLKPGGHTILTGGPLWSSALGHHLWVRTPDGVLKFPAPDCPIEPWSHLVLSEQEMQHHLESLNRFTPDTVQNILRWVYHSTALNRLTDRHIHNAIEQCSLEIVAQNHTQYRKKNSYFEKAQKILSDTADITVNNCKYLLVKA